MRLLRVEGVNMRFVIEDTQDLRTISGGSQMLLTAIHEVGSRYSKTLKAISLGASSGLFEVLEPGPGETATSEGDVAGFLRTEYPHATFVVSTVEGAGDFDNLQEAAIASNRWAQMCQPSSAFPRSGRRPDDKYKDHLRPATVEEFSASVSARRGYSKTDFHADFAKLPGLTPCHDLTELATDGRTDNLSGKLAVIYADGNSFRKKLATAWRRAGNPIEALRSLDASMQERRRELLGAVVAAAERTPETDHVRLETLLWGGDELIWVVPAWRGWETLQLFYEKTRWWVSNDKEKPEITATAKMGETPLHHAAGIVFCHSKSHIHRVVALAKRLADIAKRVDRGRGLFAYQVLESFDVTGLDVEGFRRSLAPVTGSGQEERHATMVLDGESMRAFAETFARYKDADPKDADPPRRKVHQLARAILRGPGASIKVLEDLEKEATADFKSVGDLLSPLQTVDTEDAFKRTVPWLHINELWDYVGVSR